MCGRATTVTAPGANGPDAVACGCSSVQPGRLIRTFTSTKTTPLTLTTTIRNKFVGYKDAYRRMGYNKDGSDSYSQLWLNKRVYRNCDHPNAIPDEATTTANANVLLL